MLELEIAAESLSCHVNTSASCVWWVGNARAQWSSQTKPWSLECCKENSTWAQTRLS